jgi:guanylate cyclase soluble subunit beta
MYGMIHVAVRKMVTDDLGESGWAQVLKATGYGGGEFISASTYDDGVTLAIVGASASACSQDLDHFLERLGQYWICFASDGAYKSLMAVTGADLLTFLENLDRLHTAVQAAMPAARLPSFTVTDSGQGYVRVAYASERTGMESFVTGLLQGLLHRFGHAGKVREVGRSSDAIDFEIVY